MGCPHMTLKQLEMWTERVENGLKESGNKKVLVPTVFTSAPDIIEEFNKTEYAERLKNTGVILSYICPLMYMNNPLSKKCLSLLHQISFVHIQAQSFILMTKLYVL